MAELFKFRCSQCAKLLGVAPRKVGRAVHCPRCGTELVVPAPDDPSAVGEPTDDDDPTEFADLGIDLGFASTLDIRPPERTASPTPERSPTESEALAFLDRIADEGIAGPPDPSPSRPTDPDDPTGPAEDADEPEPLVAAPAEPLVARARAGRGHAATFDRRRDVNLPRTAVTAWAMFALFALASSFVAGLLLGHYHWK